MIYYQVKRTDILKASSFTWSWVLQTKFNCTNLERIRTEFYEFLKELKPKVLYNKITIAEANQAIYKKVAELTEKYPKNFPSATELGWFSKQILADRFVNGEVAINTTYTVNTMIADRLELLERVKEEAARRQLREEEELLRKQETDRLREEARVPIAVGMLFRTKEGIARAFTHQYPADTKLSYIRQELGNALVLEHGKHCNGRKTWKVIEIIITGGMAYQEDLVWANGEFIQGE